MSRRITLSREQLVAAMPDRFPRLVRKGEVVHQTCGWHGECPFVVEWTQKRKGIVDWHPDMIDHIWKSDHYEVTCR